jgi:hypothetical protein
MGTLQGWRKLQNEELHNHYYEYNRQIKGKEMTGTFSKYTNRKMKSVCKILLEENTPLRRHSSS